MKIRTYTDAVILGFIFSIAFLDIIGIWLGPTIDRINFWLWILSYLFFFALSLSLLLDLAKNILRRNSVLAPLVMFTLIGIVVTNAASEKNLSGETAIETACAVNHILHSDDWGFRGTCLFGYPTRQLYLPAIPTLLFGRSLLALHLGGSLYVVIGLVIFTGGALKFFRYSRTGDLIVAILLSSIFHFYYVTHYLLFYGETIIPFDISLLLVGLHFLYRSEKKMTYLYLATLAGLYLAHSYIPGLSVFFLLILSFFYILVSPAVSQKHKIIVALLLFVSLSSLMSSLLYRGDVRFSAQGTRTSEELFADVQTVLRNLVVGTDGPPAISRFYAPIFIVTLLSVLLFTLGWKEAVIGMWMVGVLLLSVILKGYLYLGAVDRLYRFNPVVPIFLSVFSTVLFKGTIEHKQRYLMALFIYVLISGMYQFNMNTAAREPKIQYRVLTWLKSELPQLPNSKQTEVSIGLDPQISALLGNINDFSRYFLPEAQFVPLPSREGIECFPASQREGINIVVLDEEGPCYTEAKNKPGGIAEISSPIELHGDSRSDRRARRVHLFVIGGVQ